MGGRDEVIHPAVASIFVNRKALNSRQFAAHNYTKCKSTVDALAEYNILDPVHVPYSYPTDHEGMIRALMGLRIILREQ